MNNIIMNHDLIGYNKLLKEAMISIIKKTLNSIKNNGLPGDHHIYVTFSTTKKGISLSNKLISKFPDEMTIVLHHQFHDLEVKPKYFSVTLHFDNIPEKILVPYEAILKFYDPAANFGIDFNLYNQEKEYKDDIENKKIVIENGDSREDSIENLAVNDEKGEVISLKDYIREK